MRELDAHAIDGGFPSAEEVFGEAPGASLHPRIKPELRPGERVLWAGRGQARPLASIPAFPSLFAATLCGLSGFALTVLFGIYGFRPMDLGMLLLLGLAPGVLGGIAVIGMTAGWARHRLRQWRITRTFYALTDRRAIVGWERPDDVAFCAWDVGTFDDTLRIDHGGGIGSVYFVRRGEVVVPNAGFEEVRDAARVEAMIREVLLGQKPPAGMDLGEL